MDVEHVLSAQNELGEGPLWLAQERALYWVDILKSTVHSYVPSTGKYDIYNLGLPVGCLGARAGGGFVVAMCKGFVFWDPRESRLHYIADPESDKPWTRFNDGAVDRGGRFWAGSTCSFHSLCSGPAGTLYRVDGDGSVHAMESGLGVANGIGWSPDNRLMYLTDSRRHVIYAYDFDLHTGAISNRRTFVESGDEPGVPDGLTVDSEGFVWSCRWGGWKIARYDPQGRLEREERLPVECPTSCAFGGDDLDELYITSAHIAAANRQEQPLAGDIFRLRPGVRGLPEPMFAG
ncbi:MAG: SMP-30/gluconolactonase/LRE family protein [Rhodobacteraceae bacterium]|nr:SMP-30/gluconolactonase/LRE family protein [Paracoccaceae bacterium]